MRDLRPQGIGFWVSGAMAFQDNTRFRAKEFESVY